MVHQNAPCQIESGTAAVGTGVEHHTDYSAWTDCHTAVAVHHIVIVHHTAAAAAVHHTAAAAVHHTGAARHKAVGHSPGPVCSSLAGLSCYCHQISAHLLSVPACPLNLCRAGAAQGRRECVVYLKLPQRCCISCSQAPWQSDQLHKICLLAWIARWSPSHSWPGHSSLARWHGYGA